MALRVVATVSEATSLRGYSLRAVSGAITSLMAVMRRSSVWYRVVMLFEKYLSLCKRRKMSDSDRVLSPNPPLPSRCRRGVKVI